MRRRIEQIPRQPETDQWGWAKGKGKRKRCVAWAWVRAGKGGITVNGQPLLKYFKEAESRAHVVQPLNYGEYTGLVDVRIIVRGGGLTGQQKASGMAVARAL